MNASEKFRYEELYQKYLIALKLQRFRPKTIDGYSRAIRKITEYFDCCPNTLTKDLTIPRYNGHPVRVQSTLGGVYEKTLTDCPRKRGIAIPSYFDHSLSPNTKVPLIFCLCVFCTG